MMSWLTPIGFLGLIGLIILIIIYLIKPNYQNKIISSTFIWRLSLKYKKKKIPISKLRNILLFLCQVLAITIASLILAQPFIDNSVSVTTEKVIIIDASGSMMANVGGQTRFERAVEAVRTEADEMLEEGGKVSIILASTTSSYLVQQSNVRGDVMAALDELVDPSKDSACTYGNGDIAGAIKLAEEVTAIIPDVAVVLYTDTEYIDAGKVTVKSVRDISDWNAAILNVRAVIEENRYRFEIDVACYGKNADIPVYCTVAGINETIDDLELQADVRCVDGEVTTLIFSVEEEEDMKNLYSYNHLYVHIEEMDTLDTDNSFYLYGGEKLPLRIQYCSSAPNNYFATAMMVIKDQLRNRWDVDFVEVKKEEQPETEGFDIYIYEHTMPASLPDDGVVLLVNPDEVPTGAGFRLGSVSNYHHNEQTLLAGDEHPVLRNLKPELITVTQYVAITSYDGYTPVLYCNQDPVLIVKNEPEQKIAVLSFSLNYSNLPLMLEFPQMMYNLIEHYIPSTVTEYVFDVNESIDLGARSEELNVVGNGVDTTITEFPSNLLLVKPGVYTVSQTPISGVDIIENFYVKIPASESNIQGREDTLVNPYLYTDPVEDITDLILYFAIALVVLLFCEWWLNIREQY
ncbi:MAG: VWA domain-containing protein [Ruminococcaceae bacterium]|nr:VWA domain-containing protein [Oscillospiraceae bacterium]